MNIYTIYRARNIITDESYIGFTSSNLSLRQCGHRYKAFTEQSQNKFYTAIRKYGWNCFEWSELYQAKEECSHNDSHTLNVMENYFITEYSSVEKGYNTNIGGGKYPVLLGEDNPMFGKNHRPDSIELMRRNRGDLSGENNPMYGIKRTEKWLDEHVRGINHPMYGRKHTDESKKLSRGEDITCDHCGKVSNRGNHHRWHGDNCKHK